METQGEKTGQAHDEPAPEGDPPKSLLESIREARFTWSFVLANVAVYFLAVKKSGAGWGAIPPSVMDEFGAFVPERIPSEPWRLVTGIFVNRFLLFLALTVFFLMQIGPMVEKAMGAARFAVFYILAGIACASVGLLLGFERMAYAGTDPVFALYGVIPAIALAQTGSLGTAIAVAIRIEGPYFAMLFLANYLLKGRSSVSLDVWRLLADWGVGLVIASPLLLQRAEFPRARKIGWLLTPVVAGAVAALVVLLIVRGEKAITERPGFVPASKQAGPPKKEKPKTPKEEVEKPKPEAPSIKEPADVKAARLDADAFLKEQQPLAGPATDEKAKHAAMKKASALEELESKLESNDLTLDPETGQLYLVAGMPAQASQVLSRVKASHQDRPDVLAAYAIATLLANEEAGNPDDEPVGFLRQAIQKDNALVDAHYWLGRALLAIGKNASAREAYEAFVKLAGDAPSPRRAPLVQDAKKRLAR